MVICEVSLVLAWWKGIVSKWSFLGGEFVRSCIPRLGTAVSSDFLSLRVPEESRTLEAPQLPTRHLTVQPKAGAKGFHREDPAGKSAGAEGLDG